MNTPSLLARSSKPTEQAFAAAAVAAEVVNASSEYETTIQGTPGGGAQLICIEAGESEALEFTIDHQGTLVGHRMAEVQADGLLGPYRDAVGTHLWNSILELVPPPPMGDMQLREAAAALTLIRDQHTETIQRLHLAFIARNLQCAEPDLTSFLLTRDGIESGEDVALVAVMDANAWQVDEDRTEELRVKYFAADGKTAEDYSTLLDARHSVAEAAAYRPSPTHLA